MPGVPRNGSMNETLKSIVDILEDSKPELQIAAVQVLGELRPKEAAVAQSLAKRMAGGNDFLTRHILVTLGKIGTAGAVRELVACLLEGMPSADLASHLLSEMGPQVEDPLCEAFATAVDTSSSSPGRTRLSNSTTVTFVPKAL